MSISKQEYIYRSLKKISHKGWEVFVISRIIHGLDDDEIEFVTQQLVRLPNGKRALTDIYFPQFNLHVEVDEGYHEEDEQKKLDDKRELDIIQRTGHNLERVKVADGKDKKSGQINYRSLSDIRCQVDQLVEFIKVRKKEAIENEENDVFVPWDIESRYSPEPVIERGYVSISDKVVFRTQLDALRCFGFTGKGFQRAAWKIKDGSGDSVWFPRLYKHGIWENELSHDGTRINAKALVKNGVPNREAVEATRKQLAINYKKPDSKWIVFAKSRDSLGFNLLRYVGTFSVNLIKSTEAEIVFDRISDQENIRPTL